MTVEAFVEVIVEVLEARNLFAPRVEGEYQPPDVFITTKFLGQKNDSRDAPSQCEEGSTHVIGVRHSCRLPLSEDTRAELLSKVLNTHLTLSVHRSDTGMAITTCTVSLEEFILGVHTIEKENIELERIGSPDAIDSPKASEGAFVGLNIRMVKSEMVDGNPEADEAPGEGEPIVTPYTLVPQHEVEKSCVVEFTITATDEIPRTLLDVNAQLPEDTLQFSVALGLGVKDGKHMSALQLDGGVLEEASLSWRSSKRFFLSAEAMKILRETLEDGGLLPFEIARYVSPEATGFVDPAFEVYHGIASTDVAAVLLEPGAGETTVRASSFRVACSSSEVNGPMLLALPAENPNAKAKPIEAAPDPESQNTCQWRSTSITFHIKFSRSLIPPWKPPPKPQKSLMEIVPKRPPKPPPAPLTASMEFKNEVKQLLSFLKVQYDECGTAESACVERKKKLIFELNRSGKYLQIQTQLKVHVEKIIKERYKKKGELSKETIAGQQNDLYVYLLDIARDAIKPPEKPTPDPPVPEAAELLRLQQRANEYELAGCREAAEKRHQERLVVSEDAQIWYDCATFYMRGNKLGLAEECFREVLSLEHTHSPSCLSLACLLLHNAMVTDPAFLEDAEVFAHAAKELEPENPAVWAIISIIMEEASRPQDELVHVHHEVKRLAKEGVEKGESGIDVNGYHKAATFMLEIRLPYCADRAIKHALGLQASLEEPDMEIKLNEAKSAHQKGDKSTAMDLIKTWNRLADDVDTRGYLLLGDILFRSGDLELACNHYQHALLINVQGFPLEAYINLGACFIYQKDWQSACDVYLQGCVQYPCVSLWLGVGISYMRLGEDENAELALSEANILDNRHALVWGYLGLLALKTGRDEEAKLAISRAFEEDLIDSALITEIGEHYMKIGYYRDAEMILRQLLQIKTTPQVLDLLGCALQEQNKYIMARTYFLKALENQDDPGKTILLQKLIQVDRKLGNMEELAQWEEQLKGLREEEEKKSIKEEETPVEDPPETLADAPDVPDAPDAETDD